MLHVTPARRFLRISLVLVAGLVAAGCETVASDGYLYDNGYASPAPYYYPAPSGVTIYEPPTVVYTAPPPGWRVDAWREHQRREAYERHAERRRDMDRRERERDRRDWERQRDAQRHDAERRREAERRDADRRRDAERQRDAQAQQRERERREAERRDAHAQQRDRDRRDAERRDWERRREAERQSRERDARPPYGAGPAGLSRHPGRPKIGEE